jgi:hypothetical protein
MKIKEGSAGQKTPFTIHCKNINGIPGFFFLILSDTGKNLYCKGFFCAIQRKDFYDRGRLSNGSSDNSYLGKGKIRENSELGTGTQTSYQRSWKNSRLRRGLFQKTPVFEQEH